MKVEPTHQIDTDRTIWIYSNIKFKRDNPNGLSISNMKTGGIKLNTIFQTSFEPTSKMSDCTC